MKLIVRGVVCDVKSGVRSGIVTTGGWRNAKVD